MARFMDYSKLKAITRKDHFLPPFIDPLVERLVGRPYYCVLDGYSSYHDVPLDPDKQKTTILTFAFGVVAYCRMPFGSCNALTVESMAKDCKLSTCGRQSFVTFSFLLSVDLVLLVFIIIIIIIFVFFKTCVCHSSLGWSHWGQCVVLI
jgi:hypothetical protein